MKYVPTADAHITTSESGRRYSNIRIRAGNRAIIIDPDAWPELKEQIEVAYEIAIDRKSSIRSKN